METNKRKESSVSTFGNSIDHIKKVKFLLRRRTLETKSATKRKCQVEGIAANSETQQGLMIIKEGELSIT